MTFKSVLFTKETCLPCAKTKDYLRELLTNAPALGNYISVLQKENHTALVEAYGLKKYPTLLIVDGEGEEVARLVGGQLVREDLRGVLFALRAVDK